MLFEYQGVRAASEIVIRRPYGTPISGAADLGGCAKRKHCCSAREHWTEGRGLVVFFLGGGGVILEGFLVAVYCFYYYYCLLKANNKIYCIVLYFNLLYYIVIYG